jgi:hypothetical protein
MVQDPPIRSTIATTAEDRSMMRQAKLFHYSHTTLNKWFLAICMFFVLWVGCSMRDISSVLYERRYYHFIRTMMLLVFIYSIPKTTKLKENVETDELCKKAGLKGRSYQAQIRKIGRKPRRRGLKAPKGRGTFEKVFFPMVVSMHQRGGATRFDVPTNKAASGCPLLQFPEWFETFSLTIFPVYDSLPSYGFGHESVNHSDKE